MESDEDLQTLYTLAVSSRIDRVDVAFIEYVGSSTIRKVTDSSSSNVDGRGFGSLSGVSKEVDLLLSFAGHKPKVLKLVT